MKVPERTAQWSIAALRVDLAELEARLGPRMDWFERRVYVWNFEKFREEMKRLGAREPGGKPLIGGLPIFEDKSLPEGKVEVRLVPKEQLA